ncbi:NACHT domain-containing protein [Mucilaginibacter glaciei]|uniref:NACHT domain-containing protein n=1 Tax=Mucilaginibacter glaciei TaxID=2772109 RepID=A0A926S825_9SPHI|nr:hypothetical protein [Mucilaginibacter glaciei]MBD1395321.1 hypothetical protein [Mucilaginibacter glaciei]
MTIFLPQYFEILKGAVLKKAGLASITPYGCKTLSTNIFAETKFSLSETTLKRVYGFALSKFNPSIFTIDTMAKYCGYLGWDDFCEKQNVTKPVKDANQTNDWNSLKQSANKITTFTLQALKNKSGIPYNQTIKRRFVDEHLDEFLNGDYSATVFCAPAGCGKTIGLCHWVEEHLSPQLSASNNDIILFFSSSAIMNVFLSGRNLTDWVLGLLGYSSDADMNLLTDQNHEKEGNFILIIDGLDEYAYKTDQFQQLINQLIDVFAMYKYTPWFKMVLNMRTTTWINNLHILQANTERWFNGFAKQIDTLSGNVPLFSVPEIKELCLNINPSIQNFIAFDLAEHFNHPLYFQFYYKEYKEDFTLNNIDHVCIYELISTFILNKVYLGQHSADKLTFLKLLVKAMELKNHSYQVPKLKINSAIKQYPNAYNELLSIGFIRELNTSTSFGYDTNIHFGNDSFLQHTLAKELLQDHDFIFDEKLIQSINLLFDNEHKLYILKWCIIYATKTAQQNSFDMLPKAHLNLKQKSNLILFLGDLLDKACSPVKKSETIVQYFKKDSSDEFFNYFFGMEFICSDYEKTLQTLLKFELSNRKKIIAYTGLATIAVLQLDMSKLHRYINTLKSFPQNTFQKFTINPLTCLETLYQFFKYGHIKKDLFVDITKFNFNPALYSNTFPDDSADELIYILAGNALLLCNKPQKVIRFVNALRKLYKKPLEPFTPYIFFKKTLIAQAYTLLGDTAQVLEVYKKVATIYSMEEDSFTPYMKSMFNALKIKKAILIEDYESIPAYLKQLTTVCGSSGNKLSRAFIYAAILKTPQIAQLNPAFYQQVRYENMKILREGDLRPDLFVQAEVLNNA